MSDQASTFLMSIDVKKCRFRIHRPILDQLANPRRVQFLFNEERYGIMIMKIGKNVPISQSLKVSFDKPGKDGSFELYSKALMTEMQRWDKRLETKGLYHITGHVLPDLDAICFPFSTLRQVDYLSQKGKQHDTFD